MTSINKVAVLGGGSWATAIVKILTETRQKVGWYLRDPYAKEHLLKRGHNPNYLSSVLFDVEKLALSNDINEVVSEADYLILVIPSAYVSDELKKIKSSLENKVIFSAIKGIVPETGRVVARHLHETYNLPYDNLGVISGPCHAEEVALERLSYLTVACTDKSKAKIMADMMQNHYINTTVTDDIIGAEYAAMLKNIYAIAAGIAHGLGYGDNFQSVLMSNAIREMKRFIKRVHKMKRNINNSAYLGDLLVTGYSVFSRNRMFGNMIGKGYTVQSAMMEMQMVAEGYFAAKSAWLINSRKKRKSHTPIINAVYNILYENKDPKKIFKKLTEELD